MLDKIKKWWHGEDIFHENKPSDPIFIIGWHNKKHWTSSFVHWVLSLIINPEKRARLLAVIAVATFLILLSKNPPHSKSNQEPTNVNGNNREPQRDIRIEQNQ